MADLIVYIKVDNFFYILLNCTSVISGQWKVDRDGFLQ